MLSHKNFQLQVPVNHDVGPIGKYDRDVWSRVLCAEAFKMTGHSLRSERNDRRGSSIRNNEKDSRNDSNRNDSKRNMVLLLPPKSTSTRLVITVPPRGIGPVVEPNENDVLCGRGRKIWSFVGNFQFREIISKEKEKYHSREVKKLDKAHIGAKLVRHIRSMNPSGRFLKQDSEGSPWYDIGDEKAIKKVCQALRENGPVFRKVLSEKEEDPCSPTDSVGMESAKTEPDVPSELLTDPRSLPPALSGEIMHRSLLPFSSKLTSQYKYSALCSALRHRLASRRVLPMCPPNAITTMGLLSHRNALLSGTRVHPPTRPRPRDGLLMYSSDILP